MLNHSNKYLFDLINRYQHFIYKIAVSTMQNFHDRERTTVPKSYYDYPRNFQYNQYSDKKLRKYSCKQRNKTFQNIPNRMQLIPQSLSISINDQTTHTKKNSDIDFNQRINRTQKKKNSINTNKEQLQTISKFMNFTKGQIQANIYNSTVISGQQPTLYKIANSFELSNRKKQSCENHPNKMAQFILFHGTYQNYLCQKCASNIITKNYSNVQDSKNTDSNPHKSVVSFGLEQLNKAKWEKQIRKLLNEMSITRETHIELLNDCAKIEQIYQKQIELLDVFYTTLIQTITHYRNEHLKGFRRQCSNIVKEYEKQTQYLTKAMIDIDNISQDIRINIDSFLNSQSEREFKGVMEYYENTLQILNRKAQNIGSTIKIYPQFKEDNLQEIINSIEQSIQNLISSQNCKSRSLYTCIKPLSLKIKQFNKTKKAPSLLSVKIEEMNAPRQTKQIHGSDLQQQEKVPIIRVHNVLPQEIQRCRSAQNLIYFQKINNKWEDHNEAQSPYFKRQ